MATLRKSFLVRAPAFQVFDVLTDHTKYTRWFDFIREVTYPEGKKSGVGAKSHWITQIAGIRGELDVAYKEWVPGKRVRVENVGPYFRNSEGSFTLSQDPNGILVDFEIHYDVPLSIFGQFLDRLVVGRELEHGFERGFARMKQALEGEAVAGTRWKLLDLFWSALGAKFGSAGSLSGGYMLIAAEDPESPAERFLIPLFARIAQQGLAKLIILSTDLSRLSFEETVSRPMRIDLGMSDTYFINLTGLADSHANLTQDPSTLTSVSLAISTARKTAIQEGKLPLLFFSHLDPLIAKFGDNQVARFLHETAVRAREMGSFECYVITRPLCSDSALASFVSSADAAFRFAPRNIENSPGAVVEFLKVRGVNYERSRIPLTFTEELRYDVAS